MKELFEELNVEELEEVKGGKISKAQCAYFWGLCFSGASDTYGCGSTYANCDYYNKYCK